MISFLYKQSKGWRWLFAVSVVATLLSTLFSFLLPKIIMVTIDSVIDSKPYDLPSFIVEFINSIWSRDFLRENLQLIAALAVVTALLSGIMNYIRRFTSGKYAEGVVRDLRNNLFYTIEHLPFSWHIKMQTGDIIQRCISDVETIRTVLSVQVVELIRVAIMAVLAIVMMLTISPLLTLVTLVFLPIVAGYSVFFYKKMGEQFLVADETEGELMTVVQENLTGVRVVRAFGRERAEIDKFNEVNDRYAGLWINLGKLLSSYWGLGDFITGFQNAIILCGGAYLVINTNTLTLGGLVAFLSYTQQIIWPIRSLGRLISQMSRAGVSIDRIRDILDAEPESDKEGALTPDLEGDIEFKNVSFGYEKDMPILKNISFKVPNGTTLAILGATGSGKSSIAHLLPRLYEPTEGVITIDGIDIEKIALKYLRKNVGLVLQEPFLFSRSIADNIRAGNTDIEIEELRKSATIACVDSSITEFEHGYDTIVGERGVTLSGGQKQRVAISRTLAQNPSVLIFDDSLSAVDTETDMQIRKALKESYGSKTTILISHRAATLMQADNIIVLEDGRIVSEGPHDKLINEDGLYRRIFEIQNGVREEEDA